MTFFHCINCILLTVAPFPIYYKASGLTKEGQFGVMLKSGLYFVLASIVKLAITATLANVSPDAQHSFLNELLYAFHYCIDAMALAYLINSYKIEIMSRVELVAIGWSATEVVSSKLFPLIVYSRSPEVDYKWLQFSLDSTFDLVFTISFALACWLALCAKGKMAPTKLNFAFLGAHILLPGILSYLKDNELIGGWCYLALHGLLSVLLLEVGKRLFAAKSEALKA